MIEIKDKKECMGCRSCEQICLRNAIKMEQDKEGFIYPVVEKSLCINCGLCNKSCPIQNEYVNKASYPTPITYAGWNNDDIERKLGSSGGVFSAVSEYIFSLKGVVCGVGFDNELNVKHKFANDKDEMKEFKGSKYVQSDTNKTFRKTKEFLDNDKVVLYTGTPCQIAGLRSYLRKEYRNLYTLDVVCHGVPSPKVYKKYLKELEILNASKISNVNFRDKRTGWKKYSIKINFKNKKTYKNIFNKDTFMQGFLKDVYLRPSCYDCKFSKLPRSSDITLGDFWGVKNRYPELDDDKGTSLLLMNTKKGQEILEKCKDKLFTKEADINYALKYNPCINASVKPNKNREYFFTDLDEIPFQKLARKYFPPDNIVKRGYYKGRTILSKIKNSIIRKKETYEK